METDESMVDEGLSSLYCCLDQRRPCTPECMAYTTHSSPGGELNEQQGHCVFLVGVTRIGKHAVIIASMLCDQRVIDKKRREDNTRTSQPPPPSIQGIPHGR